MNIPTNLAKSLPGIRSQERPRVPYGCCPECGAPGVSRERRPFGNDRCEAGHTYPSAKAVEALDGTAEKGVVKEIVVGLQQLGYTTPAKYVPGSAGIFMRVGQRRADKVGGDEGTPDLIVVKFTAGKHVARCGETVYLFEIKARTKKAIESKEQMALKALGVTHVVRSAREVFEVIRGA